MSKLFNNIVGSSWVQFDYTLISKCLFVLLMSVVMVSCKNKKEDILFRLIESEHSGITFSNEIAPTKDLNIFNYMYFYNGGGVGAGDLNNDGLTDLIFTANQKRSKIYLNQGGLKFKDITEQSNFKAGLGWSNGVSIVDINQDGMLDFYISQVGNYETLQGHNLLFVCKEIKGGVPIYEEQSKQYGLDLVGFGTQAAFIDFDLDGDLDFFQLNHSVHKNGTFGKREVFLNTFHPLAGDRFFINIDNKFIEKTRASGIHSSALGYGLGIAAGDLNFDGYPDLYIGNDFHENDYLYINQKNGVFKDEIDTRIRHTSRFTMGVDIADLNNDVFPEIVSLDMLPYKPDLLKRSEGEDAYYNFNFKIKQGYNYQFARNNLQLNNGDDTFSEIGLFANMHATDWSWSSLFMDFDNDGIKDLFISNGINKRMNDMDYINHVSNDEIQAKIENKSFDESDESLVDLLPEVKIPNVFFKNNANLQFEKINERIDKNPDSYSNGAIYADLDNDGDLDIVTNNINDKAFVYENQTNKILPKNKSLTISLRGSEKNKNAIGSKILVFEKTKIQAFEKFPVRGFQSSSEVPMVLGLGINPQIDSILIIWPNKTYQKIGYDSTKTQLNIVFKNGLQNFDFEKFKAKRNTQVNFEDNAKEVNLSVSHVENSFNEFDREALIPNQISREGPAVAVADINHDGLEDLYLGSSRDYIGRVFLQNKKGRFDEKSQKALQIDSTFEDIDAKWVDLNHDTHLDLVVASGGNEFFGKSEWLKPRVYFNDGTGYLRKANDSFINIFVNASVVVPFDFNKDGHIDLFIGGRSVPFGYGKKADSYLFQNDGKGNFKDVTAVFAPEFKALGFVKDAKLIDINSDKIEELVVALEWDGIAVFDRKFKKSYLTNKKGWWNFVHAVDIDADGDLDILAGNLGLNSRLKATDKQPVKMYINDFDDNERVEQILTYFVDDKEVIFADKREIERQLPYVKKKYLMSKDFSVASLDDIFGKKKIAESNIFESNYFENSILINDGNGNFELKALPKFLQYSPLFDVVLVSNFKGISDFIFASNTYDANIQMGLYDASFGGVYSFDSKLNVSKSTFKNLPINGQVRKVLKIRIAQKDAFLLVKNNDKLMVLSKK
jgi:hypothetical protein